MKKRPRAKPAPRQLQYKVVELSTVDEGSIEDALNTWTARGWNFEGLQFAMRESSKRPAMAFVFLTRDAELPEHDEAAARAKLRRLAGDARVPGAREVSAFERLVQLASDDEDPDS